MKIEDYVRVYKNSLSEDICKTAQKDFEKIPWHDHTFYNSVTDSSYKNKNDCKVSFDNVSVTREITDCVGNSIVQYISDLGLPYFKQMQGFSPVIFHKYNEFKSMEMHCDHIHSLFDTPNFDRRGIPILSVVGVLNDDYTGGKFLMYDSEYDMDIRQGDIIVFPSVFLYPHKVSPVTKGTRYSFVSWGW